MYRPDKAFAVYFECVVTKWGKMRTQTSLCDRNRFSFYYIHLQFICWGWGWGCAFSPQARWCWCTCHVECLRSTFRNVTITQTYCIISCLNWMSRSKRCFSTVWPSGLWRQFQALFSRGFESYYCQSLFRLTASVIWLLVRWTCLHYLFQHPNNKITFSKTIECAWSLSALNCRQALGENSTLFRITNRLLSVVNNSAVNKMNLWMQDGLYRWDSIDSIEDKITDMISITLNQYCCSTCIRPIQCIDVAERWMSDFIGTQRHRWHLL